MIVGGEEEKELQGEPVMKRIEVKKVKVIKFGS